MVVVCWPREGHAGFMDDALVKQVLELHRCGLSVRSIATQLGVSRSAVGRLVSGAVLTGDADDDDDDGRVPPVDDADDDDAKEYVLRVLVGDCMGADGTVDRESALWRLVFPTDPGLVRAQHLYAVKRFAQEQYL